MIGKQISIDSETMKGLLAPPEDFLGPLVEAVVQEGVAVESIFVGQPGSTLSSSGWLAVSVNALRVG
jgi:hypothetical protein